MSNVNDWIWLFIACPANGCDNNIETYWSHRNCPNSEKDHDIKINSAGYLKCNACNTTAALIKWRFDCGCGHGLKEANNIFRLIEILQIMKHANRADEKFIGRLMVAIGNMFT
jgi:hypothetical protein